MIDERKIMNENEELRIVWENIVVTLEGKKGNSKRKILDNLVGGIKSGECLSIMGASGAGKSTFLNVISGRFVNTKKIKLTGNILLNGKKFDFNKFRKQIGFVMQSDLFFEFLTVRQCFEFAARLKMPKSNYKQQMERVNYIIKILKLEKAENTLVGGKLQKGISGGEKKRLNIGFELISNPRILYLDEPTSGLDSYTSYVIVNLLKRLAKEENMIIIYTIHQPSTDIFNIFDNLLLLNRGRKIYYGDCQNSINFFSENGFPIPDQTNPSDYYLKIMQSKDEVQLNKLDDNYEKLLSKEVKENSENLKKISEVRMESVSASFFRQFGALTKRAFLNFKSNPFAIKIRMIQTLFLSFIFCSIFYKMSDDPKNPTAVYNRQGALFFLVINNFINYMMNVLLTFPLEREVFLKEYNSGFYGIIPYYISKLMVEIPIVSFFPILTSCITYYIVNFNNETSRFFYQWLGLVVLAISGSMYGMFVGTIVTDFKLALEVAPLFFLPFILFSGYTSNSGSIFKGLKWIEYISPIRYMFEFSIYNEFEGTKFQPNPIDILKFTFGKAESIYYTLIFLGVIIILTLIFLRLKAKMIN